jgi:BirA family biotin operon repressor/biotin-[acetyl-CoA-carboxylase] ligase
MMANRAEILRYLLERKGSFVSGEEMAACFGITRASIWKAVSSLRAIGYPVEASPKKGYCLRKDPDILDPELIHHGLSGLGRQIYYYFEVDSTNSLAGNLAGNSHDGTVVLAEVQTSGRGRLSRPWSSPPGGIWMSLILKPSIPPLWAYRLNMAGAVGVSRAIKKLYDIDARIKWPNDLVVEDKKLCGLLTEISAEMDRLNHVVVGIGINANNSLDGFPQEWNATSISQELGRPVNRGELIRSILEETDMCYRRIEQDFETLHQAWVDLSATLEKRVRIVSSGGEISGTASALDKDGALVVRLDGGDEVKVLAGDCIHLRSSTGAQSE